MRHILLPLISLAAFELSAHEITAYACDTCDSQGAQVLAKSYAPSAKCNFINPPGIVPTDCFAPAKQLIVVNPLTEQSYKYRVQQQCQSDWCDPNITLTHLTLTVDEAEIMTTYYDIDSTMRSAIGQMNTLVAMTINNNYFAVSNTTGDECPNNPMDYFTDIAVQREVEKQISLKVHSKVGLRPWREFITTSYAGPSNFQIGRRTANVTIDQRHISQPAYERYHFGTERAFRINNNLNFRVNYLGKIADQPGVSTLGLQLIVDRSTSWVDGFRLSNLTPDGGTVNLENNLDSMPCFKKFITQQESEITGPPKSGGGGGNPGDGEPGLPGDGGSEWQFCPSKSIARTCWTTSDGASCTVTTFHFLKPCS